MPDFEVPETLPGLTLQEMNKLDPYQRVAYEHAYYRFLEGPSAQTYHEALKHSIAKQAGWHNATSTLLESNLEELGFADGWRSKEPVRNYMPTPDHSGEPVAEVAFVTPSVNLAFARALQRIGVRVKVYSHLDHLKKRTTPLDLIIHDERTGTYDGTKMLPLQVKFRNKTLILAGSRFSAAYLNNHFYTALSTENTYNDLFNKVIEMTGARGSPLCHDTLDAKIGEPYIPTRQPAIQPAKLAAGYKD
ncbi:hypothetical protein K9M79_06420 [Candidatus Woesearchaeota archaeon]|nr:hypothetical protein [Candidatus Woesearchaeota archaeon]